jgi:hypothetical protein
MPGQGQGHGWEGQDMIEQECQAQGFTYVDSVRLDFLEPLAEPPWTAFACGLAHGIASRTMVLEHRGGDIFSANFNARLLSESRFATGAVSHFSYSITGIRLAPGAPLARIAAYIADLALENGLRVVMRGDCVYAMVKPGGITVLELRDRQRMQLMRAMLCIAEDRFADATHLFESLACNSTGKSWIGLPLGGAALVLGLGFSIETRNPMLLIVGAVVGVIVGLAYWRTRGDRSELDAYLARRHG